MFPNIICGTQLYDAFADYDANDFAKFYPFSECSAVDMLNKRRLLGEKVAILALLRIAVTAQRVV